MAPQLQFTQIAATTSQAGMAAMMLLFCAFALFMCASHPQIWRRRWTSCLGSHDHTPIIELNTESMMLSTGLNGTSEGCRNEFSCEQQAVWKKNILMGGKCQLPDFSGVIIYDSNGNVVPPAKIPPPLLTHK